MNKLEKAASVDLRNSIVAPLLFKTYSFVRVNQQHNIERITEVTEDQSWQGADACLYLACSYLFHGCAYTPV